MGAHIVSLVIAKKAITMAKKEEIGTLEKNMGRSIQTVEDEVALGRLVTKFSNVLKDVNVNILLGLRSS